MTASLAVGVFDGFHIGHREIVERALARARESGGRCVVLSFDPHPDLVLSKTFRAQAPLTPLPERRARLLALGAELEVLPFTRELASLTPEEFVERHLVARFSPRALVVGEGFALGRGRSGDVPKLRQLGQRFGFDVEAVPLYRVDGEPVSSTRIRALLELGEIAEAARMLGRPYGLEAQVVRGDGIGRRLGFPTANLRLHQEKQLPAHGIYAVRVRLPSESRWRAGAMSIGIRPTFGGQVPTLEVFVLDWSGDLVGHDLELEFVVWLRAEVKFESEQALIAAIAADVAEVRRRLGAPAAGA